MSSWIVNVASVKQLSPFRYPGGKTWLVPEIKRWLRSLDSDQKVFIEPFAGGGIASLTAVFEDLVERALFCEIEEGMAAAWKTILNDADWLTNQILSFKISKENVNDVLNSKAADYKELAFQTILRNRVQRGGIIAPGASLVKRGENGKGVSSRWYPETISHRIQEIFKRRERFTFIQGDGFKIINEKLIDPHAVFFIDPPYTIGGKRAGKRLYTYNEVNHSLLFSLMRQAVGACMLTYDDSPEVMDLIHEHGFICKRLPMKNTHHKMLYELIIEKHERVPLKAYI